MIPQLQAVAGSSMIHSAGYDPALEIFYVKFHSGMQWRYFNVNQEEADGFWTAPSQGQYFTRVIKKVKTGEAV